MHGSGTGPGSTRHAQTLATLTGCVSVQADVPEEVVRHMARQDGVDLGATCSQDGKRFSEGAISCMANQRMVCDPAGRWVQDRGDPVGAQLLPGTQWFVTGKA